MKQLFRVLLASALLVPAALSAAAFEGKVTMKMSASAKDKDPREIIYSIKGEKIRMEFPGQKNMGGMIMDRSTKEMMMIMTDQKMYMTMAIPETATDAIEKHNGDVKLEKTGETEKILGYTATKYIATSDGTSTDMWLAEGLGTFMSMSNNNPMNRRGGAQPQQAWERALAGKELFPMRVVGHDKGGKESFRMEVTAVEKQSLPDSFFAPPEGYQKFDMGGMMGGMMKGIMQGGGK